MIVIVYYQDSLNRLDCAHLLLAVLCMSSISIYVSLCVNRWYWVSIFCYLAGRDVSYLKFH
jgi:hypothetical protein